MLFLTRIVSFSSYLLCFNWKWITRDWTQEVGELGDKDPSEQDKRKRESTLPSYSSSQLLIPLERCLTREQRNQQEMQTSWKSEFIIMYLLLLLPLSLSILTFFSFLLAEVPTIHLPNHPRILISIPYQKVQ